MRWSGRRFRADRVALLQAAQIVPALGFFVGLVLNLVSFVQQAMTAANGAIEQATKATKQAAEFAVSNMEKAAAAAPAARAKKAA